MYTNNRKAQESLKSFGNNLAENNIFFKKKWGTKIDEIDECEISDKMIPLFISIFN